MNTFGSSKEKHLDLKLRRTAPYRYAVTYHSVSLASGKKSRAAPNRPVMFDRTDAVFHPVALLSLVQNENRYLDGNSWCGGFMPVAMWIYQFRNLPDCGPVNGLS